jgi:transcription elongation factor Elf1
MSCPFCRHSSSGVVRSRAPVTLDGVRRRRECGNCGRRFPTYEEVDVNNLLVELAPELLARLSLEDTPENREYAIAMVLKNFSTSGLNGLLTVPTADADA